MRSSPTVTLAGAFIVALCHCPGPVPPSPRMAEDSATLVLLVLNASPTQSAVDIEVFLDDQQVVSDTFTANARDLDRPSIPPHKTYYLTPAKGLHTLRATSRARAARLERTVRIEGKHWALIGYEYSSSGATPPPKHQFEILFQDQRIAFQ